VTQLTAESGIPSPWYLLEATTSFVKFAHKIGMRGATKPRWLLHIKLLFQNTVKECILHIQLTKTPIARNNNREDQTDGSRLDHMTKYIIIVNAIPLLKAFGHQASLIAIDGPISLLLDFKHPLTFNDIGGLTSRDQMPRIIKKKSSILQIHGMLPSCIIKGPLNSLSWFASGTKIGIANHPWK
jgi:hypothetical protein